MEREHENSCDVPNKSPDIADLRGPGELGLNYKEYIRLSIAGSYLPSDSQLIGTGCYAPRTGNTSE